MPDFLFLLSLASLALHSKFSRKKLRRRVSTRLGSKECRNKKRKQENSEGKQHTQKNTLEVLQKIVRRILLFRTLISPNWSRVESSRVEARRRKGAKKFPHFSGFRSAVHMRRRYRFSLCYLNYQKKEINASQNK